VNVEATDPALQRSIIGSAAAAAAAGRCCPANYSIATDGYFCRYFSRYPCSASQQLHRFTDYLQPVSTTTG